MRCSHGGASLLSFADQPLKALDDALACQCTNWLDMPALLLEACKLHLLGYLLWSQCPGHVLFVRQYEVNSGRLVVRSREVPEFYTRLPDAFSVSAINDPHDKFRCFVTLCFSGRYLSHPPTSKLSIFMFLYSSDSIG